jgi:hypothetical protein
MYYIVAFLFCLHGLGIISYTMLYNVLDFPAGSLPVTKVTTEDTNKLVEYPMKDLWHKNVKQVRENSKNANEQDSSIFHIEVNMLWFCKRKPNMPYLICLIFMKN